MSVVGHGNAHTILTEAELDTIIADGLSRLPLDGRRVLLIVPDGTRTIPLPLLFRLTMRHLQPRARAVDVLAALGTHPPMSESALFKHLGLTPETKASHYAGVRLLNHTWNEPDSLVSLGTLPAAEMASLSDGQLSQDVPVRLNRLILDYDHLLICGPVFPHEVAGFSGGNKYFFPGISGPDVIDFTHWLGALITSHAIIGTQDTPVRRIIDRAASLIPRPRHALCSVVTHAGVAGLYVGTPEDAFTAAAALSAECHIVWTERAYQRVLAVLPPMYTELWVGAKGMYKTEPAIADGGEVVIYAPHLSEISQVHGRIIRQIGYHVRDYFVKQWDQFKHLPWGVIAHSTHVRGQGEYDAASGRERPRIKVTLASGIPAEQCRAVNLDYCDPAAVRPEAWAGREAEGVLLVPRAGEYLYRVKAPPA